MSKSLQMAQVIVVLFLACLPFRQTNGQTSDKIMINGLRLNQIQVIGTHNSYHLSPEPKLLELIAAASERAAEAIDYSHTPIARQLNELGIRQLELDIYADPQGGLFAKPIGKSLIGKTIADARMDFDFQSVMSKPGMKIIHSPGFDYATTVPTLIDALKQIQDWSESNPLHVPILVLIELKEDVTGPAGVKPIAFNAELLDAIDAEIRSIVPMDGMLTPDLVRGEFETLRSAIIERGWPTLADSETRQARSNDTTQRVRALASGAQFVSTDYPEPDTRFSEYCVRLENKAVARANPVSHSDASRLAKIDLELME